MITQTYHIEWNSIFIMIWMTISTVMTKITVLFQSIICLCRAGFNKSEILITVIVVGDFDRYYLIDLISYDRYISSKLSF